MKCYHTGCSVNSFSTQQCTVNTAVSGQMLAFFTLWIAVWYSREWICCDLYSHLTHRLRQYTYTVWKESENVSPSVVSNSATPRTDCSSPGSSVHGFFPGKNIGVGCHSLLQGIFPTQRLNLGFLHCSWILYSLSHQGSPIWWHFRSEDNISVKSDTLVSGENGDQVARLHKRLRTPVFWRFRMVWEWKRVLAMH